MRISNLLTNCIIVVISVFLLIGCAKAAKTQRETIVYQYTPQTEAASGSANVTFAVVNAQLAKPVQQGQVQLPNETPIKLFADFASTMSKDFMEVLGAQGFGVRGPYNSYDDMIFPDKEGSDLILTAEVLFGTDTNETRLADTFNVLNPNLYSIEGPVEVKCDVKIVVNESLTNERMWTKSIAIKPVVLELKSEYHYSPQALTELSIKHGKVFQGRSGIPLEVILENEAKFHNDLGQVLQAQYKEILSKIYTYLDPREMTVVKNQSLEIRKKKVF